MRQGGLAMSKRRNPVAETLGSDLALIASRAIAGGIPAGHVAEAFRRCADSLDRRTEDSAAPFRGDLH